MAGNTVAGIENTHTITFKNREHKKFYTDHLKKCRCRDVYHKALVYCLGIDVDTREHVERIYDFESGCVKTDRLHEGWQTSGSAKIVRMAFNLYCNNAPSVEKRTDRRMSALYGGKFILYRLCQIFLGGSQDTLSRILLLHRF